MTLEHTILNPFYIWFIHKFNVQTTQSSKLHKTYQWFASYLILEVWTLKRFNQPPARCLPWFVSVFTGALLIQVKPPCLINLSTNYSPIYSTQRRNLRAFQSWKMKHRYSHILPRSIFLIPNSSHSGISCRKPEESQRSSLSHHRAICIQLQWNPWRYFDARSHISDRALRLCRSSRSGKNDEENRKNKLSHTNRSKYMSSIWLPLIQNWLL